MQKQTEYIHFNVQGSFFFFPPVFFRVFPFADMLYSIFDVIIVGWYKHNHIIVAEIKW